MKHEQGFKPDDESRNINKKYNETNFGNQQQPPKNQEPAGSKHQTGLSGQLSDKLREYAHTHDWEKHETRTNRLKLELAFEAPILTVVKKHMIQGRLDLALRIKADFAALLAKIQEFDTLCEKRCYVKDDLMILELTLKRIKEQLCELADMMDGCCQLEDRFEFSKLEQGRILSEIQRTPPIKIVEVAPVAPSTASPKPPIETLTKTDRDILQAMSAKPKSNMFKVDIEAAAGYGKDAVANSLKRLHDAGYICRTAGARRKGWALTEKGETFSKS